MKRLIWLVILCLLVSFVSVAPAERLDDTTLMTFYDDSAFFGDSRMESFRRYIAGIRPSSKKQGLSAPAASACTPQAATTCAVNSISTMPALK